MFCAEVDERVDGVEARVLREGSGQHVDGVGERFDGELLAALDGRRFGADMVGDGDFGRACAGDHTAGVERGDDGVERVVERAFEFVDDVFGGAASDDRDGLGGRAAGDDVTSSSPCFSTSTLSAWPSESSSRASSEPTRFAPVASTMSLAVEEPMLSATKTPSWRAGRRRGRRHPR